MARTKTTARLASQAVLEERSNNKLAKLAHTIPTIQHAFKNGEYEDGRQPKTLLEMQLMSLSASIRSKDKWYEKMEDATIVDKWKQEATQQGATQELIQYVLDELKYYKSLRDGNIEISPVDGVWQADGLIPQEIKNELNNSVTQLLENVDESEKDWHPGSNNQVLDLVHPSLFCLIYGVSHVISDELVLEEMSNKNMVQRLSIVGDTVASYTVPPKEKFNYVGDEYIKSKKYQWLPSEVTVDAYGKAKFETYINNLHPVWHHQLYNPIERIFERFIPLFNRVLTDVVHPRPNRINVSAYDWYDHLQEPDGDDDEEFELFHNTRQPKQPDIPEFASPEKPHEMIDLSGRKLQVIVKLANIVLTPQNPKYNGGVWHVEGMLNEKIVASGIYYYSSENITESLLGFRDAVCEPDYEQNDNNGVRGVYGLVNDGPLSQDRGFVVTQEDRCICFPNIMQHRVSPFELVDKTKNGIRKILVFFLVDPNERILSTLHVPPQQQSWYQWNHTMEKLLPRELICSIVQYMDFPLSMEEAKKHREELMKERKYFVEQNTTNYFERPFSLCEH
jgi:hypothetical protein